MIECIILLSLDYKTDHIRHHTVLIFHITWELSSWFRLFWPPKIFFFAWVKGRIAIPTKQHTCSLIFFFIQNCTLTQLGTRINNDLVQVQCLPDHLVLTKFEFHCNHLVLPKLFMHSIAILFKKFPLKMAI